MVFAFAKNVSISPILAFFYAWPILFHRSATCGAVIA